MKSSATTTTAAGHGSNPNSSNGSSFKSAHQKPLPPRPPVPTQKMGATNLVAPPLQEQDPNASFQTKEASSSFSGPVSAPGHGSTSTTTLTALSQANQTHKESSGRFGASMASFNTGTASYPQQAQNSWGTFGGGGAEGEDDDAMPVPPPLTLPPPSVPATLASGVPPKAPPLHPTTTGGGGGGYSPLSTPAGRGTNPLATTQHQQQQALLLPTTTPTMTPLKTLLYQSMVLVAESFHLTTGIITSGAGAGGGAGATVVPLAALAALIRTSHTGIQFELPSQLSATTALNDDSEGGGHSLLSMPAPPVSQAHIRQTVLHVLATSSDNTFSQVQWCYPMAVMAGMAATPPSSTSLGVLGGAGGGGRVGSPLLDRRLVELVGAAHATCDAHLSSDQRQLYHLHMFQQQHSGYSGGGGNMATNRGDTTPSASISGGGSPIANCIGKMSLCNTTNDSFDFTVNSSGGGSTGGLTPSTQSTQMLMTSSSSASASQNQSLCSSLNNSVVQQPLLFANAGQQQRSAMQSQNNSQNSTPFGWPLPAPSHPQDSYQTPAHQQQPLPRERHADDDDEDANRTVGPKFGRIHRLPSPCPGNRRRSPSSSHPATGATSTHGGLIHSVPQSPATDPTLHNPASTFVSPAGSTPAGTNTSSSDTPVHPPLALCIEVTRQILSIAPTLAKQVKRDPAVATVITHRCCRNLTIIFQRMKAAIAAPAGDGGKKAMLAKKGSRGGATAGGRPLTISESHPYFHLMHAPAICVCLSVICYTCKEWCQNAFYNQELNALMITEGEAAGREAMESGDRAYADITMWKVIRALYKKHQHRDLRMLTAMKLTQLESEVLVCLCGAGGACSPTVAEVLVNSVDVEGNPLLLPAAAAAAEEHAARTTSGGRSASISSTSSGSGGGPLLAALLEEVCKDSQLLALSTSAETATFLAASVVVAAALCTAKNRQKKVIRREMQREEKTPAERREDDGEKEGGSTKKEEDDQEEDHHKDKENRDYTVTHNQDASTPRKVLVNNNNSGSVSGKKKKKEKDDDEEKMRVVVVKKRPGGFVKNFFQRPYKK